MALADGNGRQLDAVGDVADGMDVGHIRRAVGIDLDGAAVVQRHARRLQPQAFDIGPAADRPQEHVGLHRLIVLEVDADAAAVGLFKALQPAVELEVDALGHGNGQQPVGQRRLPAAQHRVGPVDQRHLDAKLMENAGEFIGDIAAAGDDQRLGQLFEMEDLVGGDAKLGALHIGHQRPRAGGDQDALRRDALAADIERVRIDEGRPGLEHRHLVAVERVQIDAVQPVDLAQHIVAQRRPVERLALDLPAEAPRIDQILGKMRAIDEQLLGHAAADDAGAADAIFLGDGDARAMPRRNPRRPHPAGAGTDDEQVEVISCHGQILRRSARR